VKIYLNLNLFVLYFQVIENVIIVDYCYRNKGEQQEKQHVLGKRKRSLQSLKHDGLLGSSSKTKGIIDGPTECSNEDKTK
jgi:hypothetical protein